MLRTSPTTSLSHDCIFYMDLARVPCSSSRVTEIRRYADPHGGIFCGLLELFSLYVRMRISVFGKFVQRFICRPDVCFGFLHGLVGTPRIVDFSGLDIPYVTFVTR